MCQNSVHPITSGMSIVTVLLLAVLDNAEDSCDVTGSKDSDSERVLIRIQKGRHLYTFIQGKYAKYIALLVFCFLRVLLRLQSRKVFSILKGILSTKYM